MEYLMDIEVSGYHGHLHHVIGVSKTSWGREHFKVAVDWDESEPNVPYGLFAVDIPVKDYTKEEFLTAVRDAITKEIPEVIKIKQRLAKEDRDNRPREVELRMYAGRLNCLVKEQDFKEAQSEE